MNDCKKNLNVLRSCIIKSSNECLSLQRKKTKRQKISKIKKEKS